MTARFGYTILYVPDVTAAIAFYEAAFGLELRFLHESKLYAEMETGAVTLAFAAEDMAEMSGLAIRASRKSDLAPGFELALICVDPQAAWDRALTNGATPVKPPEIKPWGQTVGYVRDLNGCLVELCSDMSSPA